MQQKILKQLDSPTAFTRVISNDGNVLVKLVTELRMGGKIPEEEERENTWGWGDIDNDKEEDSSEEEGEEK